jgi:hypothetical protein
MAMDISDEQLAYEYHIQPFRPYFRGVAQKDAYWHHQAQYMQTIVVCDAVRDVHQTAATISQSFPETNADLHLRFGVARRTKFIWLSLRELFSTIQPNRTEPLSHDKVEIAAKALNEIYINIRGTLDNLAWCILDLFGSKSAPPLSPAHVHLFGRDFQRAVGDDGLAEFLNSFAKWNSDLKTRRDPAAHRIPLSVPPAILDEEATKRFNIVYAEHSAALRAAFSISHPPEEFESLTKKVDVLYDRLQRIGHFEPVFLHHPSEGTLRIYPTVPTDVGVLVRVARGLISHISKRHPSV